MDFQQLLAKMQEIDSAPQAIDQPATEEGCGMPPPMSMPDKSDEPAPSMSVNLNAQGLDNISDMIKLFQKVNPDMMPRDPAPMPSLGAEPSIMSIKPSLPPLKMLPDMDADNDDKIGGEMDIEIKGLDRDKDGDHDMDDHDMEKKKDKEEAFGNSLNDSEPEIMDIDAATPDGNDLNRPKKTFPKVAGGDNPMQKMESTDLRAQIRAELQRRLNEAKKS
jgi:hypothetical protein